MIRRLLGALGALLAAYGVWLLLTREHGARLVGAGEWLVAGVLLHDAVLAPLVLLGLVAGRRLVPVALRAPLVVGAVVLGSVTLLAVPVLGRFGARSDNPTLLDRDYTTGWLVLAGLVVAGVAVGAVARARRHRQSRM
ncbi:MAG: hypothetical protein ACXVEC_12325 [Nocardioides sp.]